MYHSIRIGSGNPSRRSVKIIETIRPRINRSFGEPLRKAKDLNVSVKISYMTSVLDARGLAGEIAKRKLENDRATLSLFLKAINITNKAAKDMDKSDIYYLLDLGKLLPKNLTSPTLKRKADAFLKTRDKEVALQTLKKMNVIYPVMKSDPDRYRF